MSDNIKRKKGSVCIFLGMSMILSAIGIMCYNICDSYRAETAANHIVEQLKIQIPDNPDNEFDDYLKREMPVISADGEVLIGIIRIPALATEIPVAENFSYDSLNVEACRCYGSVYTNDIVIAAHNYESFFGKLYTLSVGDKVVFYDFEGKVHEYDVISQEIIQPNDIDGMYRRNSGEWDLTLFTCTWDGQTRFTVRCIRSQ